ncbi:tryptophan synthase subunit alpha [Lactiplantibacillus plantarum]|uniref:tryptophan synthase subunit alpha n=1 Tax=Lactiplantibacillus plantarum TaxID=1590 RepID=UPI001CA45C25|nr:tryptophan synthase subunit alpha [Lactiplantibacillus plantarum]MBY8573978.1 tryptophan synthase subunit alpha [Lactiplantibacillus plantarum]
MTDLTTIFKNHKAFIAFVVAGDPNFEATVDQVVALAEAGCDLVEIGIPFSDPVADGPEIQAADLRAFDQHITPQRVFELVVAIREKTTIPLVFLTYANIVYQFGYAAFAQQCQSLNVAGLIIPDMPLEASGELRPTLDHYGIALIPLIAPTSDDARIAAIAQQARGFIYVVSSLGVTGTRRHITTDLATLVAKIRHATTLPVAIGFGIHEPAQAMAQIADGVIVGSAVVHLIATHQPATAVLRDYTRRMRRALDGRTADTVD